MLVEGRCHSGQEFACRSRRMRPSGFLEVPPGRVVRRLGCHFADKVDLKCGQLKPAIRPSATELRLASIGIGSGHGERTFREIAYKGRHIFQL